VSVIGYVFGKVVYVFVSDIKKYEGYIIPAVLIGVMVLIIIYRHIVKEKEKSYGDQ
jgi:membrane protein DedA with SNARE-associated domain